MNTAVMESRTKIRIDHLLVERGLAESREKAQALILAGHVLGERPEGRQAGATAWRAMLKSKCSERMPYVSRGGYKLAGALDHWAIDVEGRVCLDVGASTGGFTDCLLQRGAARVWAIDVGHGQLDWKLRNDPRVVVAKASTRATSPRRISRRSSTWRCATPAFISITLLIPAIVPLLAPRGELVILVKPQFEVERGQVGKGGIVREPELHQAACDRVRAAVEAQGFRADIIESPILGAEGNREFLLYASR